METGHRVGRSVDFLKGGGMSLDHPSFLSRMSLSHLILQMDYMPQVNSWVVYPCCKASGGGDTIVLSPNSHHVEWDYLLKSESPLG